MLLIGQRPKDANSSRHGQPGEDARRNWDTPFYEAEVDLFAKIRV